MKNKKDRKKVKTNLFFNFFQKHKKIATCLVIGVGFLGFFLIVNYGRYVKDIVELYYLRSQNFYFTSDKLTIHGKTYEINPWGGTVNYDISISMSSLLNSIKGTTEDISYKISCESDEKVLCYFGNETDTTNIPRTINASTNSDNYVVTVKPKQGVVFKDGDKVSVTVIAESIKPYEETLSATFELVIGNYGLNFEIEDEVGSIFFDTLVTNTLDTTSYEITLTIKDQYFDEIFFDMTNTIMKQENFTSEVAQVGDNEYIKKVSFILEPKSSLLVRYFKQDSKEDYSCLNGDPPEQKVINFEKREIK